MRLLKDFSHGHTYKVCLQSEFFFFPRVNSVEHHGNRFPEDLEKYLNVYMHYNSFQGRSAHESYRNWMS